MNFVLQQYLRTSQHKFIESRFYRTFSFNSRHLFKNLCSTNESRMPSDDFSDSLTKFTGFIPMKEIEITHCRSSGSGGQSVNKLNSKVNLRFHVKSASWLCNELKEKLFEKHNTKINKDGYMIIKSELTNSQQLNKADAFRKLRQIIRDLIVVPKEPSELTKEKHRKNKLVESQERIFTKRIRSQIKQNRQGLSNFLV